MLETEFVSDKSQRLVIFVINIQYFSKLQKFHQQSKTDKIQSSTKRFQ